MNEINVINFLRNPETIRKRAKILYDYVATGNSKYFVLAPENLTKVAEYVTQEIEQNYPHWDIPYHSRWRHFDAGLESNDLSRVDAFYQSCQGEDAASSQGTNSTNSIESLRCATELTIISVLLDAGAGMSWRYRAADCDTLLSKSEGLAVAAYFMMKNGQLSSHASSPWQCHSNKLKTISQTSLEQCFQVSPSNPLVGCSGRTELLHKLGEVIEQDPIFRRGAECRLGYFADYLLSHAKQTTLHASDVLACVLEKFSAIWPSRFTINGTNLGDVWKHSALATQTPAPGFIPFHKLSQWLSYSLFEPLEQYALKVIGQELLTGLPEYRNGGLFLDLDVIAFKDPSLATQTFKVDDEPIVEWRAMTVHMLDIIGSLIRERRHQNAQELPLVKILQGGTWSAGRRIAKIKRQDGGSPIQIASDGTVF